MLNLPAQRLACLEHVISNRRRRATEDLRHLGGFEILDLAQDRTQISVAGSETGPDRGGCHPPRCDRDGRRLVRRRPPARSWWPVPAQSAFCLEARDRRRDQWRDSSDPINHVRNSTGDRLSRAFPCLGRRPSEPHPGLFLVETILATDDRGPPSTADEVGNASSSPSRAPGRSDDIHGHLGRPVARPGEQWLCLELIFLIPYCLRSDHRRLGTMRNSRTTLLRKEIARVRSRK